MYYDYLFLFYSCRLALNMDFHSSVVYYMGAPTSCHVSYDIFSYEYLKVSSLENVLYRLLPTFSIVKRTLYLYLLM